jgi:hypothetical protein
MFNNQLSIIKIKNLLIISLVHLLILSAGIFEKSLY